MIPEKETYTANFAVIYNDTITLKNNRPTISPRRNGYFTLRISVY